MLYKRESICYNMNIETRKQPLKEENKNEGNKSSLEKYVEKYLSQKGFNVTLVKQWNSKTVYDIEKDGIKERIEIPASVVEKKRYMDMVDNSFEMKLELIKMKGML